MEKKGLRVNAGETKVYRCTWRRESSRPNDGRPQSEVRDIVLHDQLEVVAFFWYLCDMLSAVGGWCENRLEDVQLLPALTSRHFSYNIRVQLLHKARHAPCQ